MDVNVPPIVPKMNSPSAGGATFGEKVNQF